MPYIKQTWEDEELADVALYNILDSEDTPINEGVKIELATDVITAGTGVTAERMNHIEQGIEDATNTAESAFSAISSLGADDIPYTPTTPADWDTEPDFIDGALDELAGRVETLESIPAPTVKGRVEFLYSGFPSSDGAPMTALAGGSTPNEQMLYWAFANSANQYRQFLCKLVGYNAGGLTFTFLVHRTSAAVGDTYVFRVSIRRSRAGRTKLTSCKTYDYNAVTVTIADGPPDAGIPMLGTVTFTDGADMDSLAEGDVVFLRFRRDVSDTATDVARVMAGSS